MLANSSVTALALFLLGPAFIEMFTLCIAESLVFIRRSTQGSLYKGCGAPKVAGSDI